MFIILIVNIVCVLSCPPSGPEETSKTKETVETVETTKKGVEITKPLVLTFETTLETLETTESFVKVTETKVRTGGTTVENRKCPRDEIPMETCPDKSEYCKLGSDHTMCQYCRIGPTCPNFCNNQLTDKDKEELLVNHNVFRRKVARGLQKGQPSASNMKKLKWDDELARIGKVLTTEDSENIR